MKGNSSGNAPAYIRGRGVGAGLLKASRAAQASDCYPPQR